MPTSPRRGKRPLQHQTSLLEENSDDVVQMSAVIIEFLEANGARETILAHLVPEGLYFGTSSSHRKRQWLLKAIDARKREMRTIPLLGLISCRPAKPARAARKKTG